MSDQVQDLRDRVLEEAVLFLATIAPSIRFYNYPTGSDLRRLVEDLRDATGRDAQGIRDFSTSPAETTPAVLTKVYMVNHNPNWGTRFQEVNNTTFGPFSRLDLAQELYARLCAKNGYEIDTPLLEIWTRQLDPVVVV